MKFVRSYPFKRLLSFIVGNSQSIRWHTQGRHLRRAANEVRRQGMRVLDVGCGGGTYAIENHLKHGVNTTLCDFSTDLLTLARRQTQEAHVKGHADFVLCSAEELPLNTGSFDFIQCMEVLEHLQHPDRALAEFRRVARPGARLIISVPHPPEWFPNESHVVEGYRAAEICRLVEDAGWKVVRVEYCMLLLSRLAIALNFLVRLPLPLVPLVALENLIPGSLRRFCLPYDIIVVAQAPQ